MQVLEPTDNLESYSNANGHFIEGFLISTKPNEAKWRINKNTGHEKVQRFRNKNFAIIPENIFAPLSHGRGGHYNGPETLQDMLTGYQKHSHGTITDVLGPFNYSDGSDDYYYRFRAKLASSKSASVLMENGAKTWVPFAVSPHIWPLDGPDHDLTDWEAIGVALVIRGAYGPDAVITKLCKGTAAQCDKSLSANSATKLCENEDAEMAQTLTSHISKSASIGHIMDSNNSTTTTTTTAGPIPNIPHVVVQGKTPVDVTAATAPIKDINNQEAVTNGPAKTVTVEQFEEVKKQLAEISKHNAELVEKDKLNTLHNLFAKVKDEKTKKELIDEFSQLEKKDVDLINEKITRIFPILKKASDEEEKPEDNGDVPPSDNNKDAKKKSKSGAVITTVKEPEITTTTTASEVSNNTESKAAAVVDENKALRIHNFLMKGGRL